MDADGGPPYSSVHILNMYLVQVANLYNVFYTTIKNKEPGDQKDDSG